MAVPGVRMLANRKTGNVFAWVSGLVTTVLCLWVAAGSLETALTGKVNPESISIAGLLLGSAGGDCRTPIEIPLLFTQPDGTSAASLSLELSWSTEAFAERYIQPGSDQNQPQILRGASLLTGQGLGFPLIAFPAEQQGHPVAGRWRLAIFPNTQDPVAAIPSGELLRIRFFPKNSAAPGSYPIRFQPGTVILSSATGPTISTPATTDGTISLGACPISTSSTTTTPPTSSTFAITTTTSQATTTTIPLFGPAVRSFTGCYALGSPVGVTITVTPPSNTQAYVAEETIPSGWTVTNISHGGRWDTVSQQIKWGPFFDSLRRNLTYSAVPDTQSSGTPFFSGRVSFDGNIVETIGATSGPKCRFHPGDTDMNWRINADELKLYGAAWKAGDAWLSPPNPIPIDYAIRAAYLWKTGELYAHNPSANCPLCWYSSFSVVSSTITPNLQPGRKTEPFKVQASLGSAVRSMPLSYVPERPVSIYLAVYPTTSVVAFGVEEAIPPGWVVQSADNGGTWDPAGKKVRWGPFFGYSQKVLSYVVMPPFSDSGIQTFSGFVSFDGISNLIAGQNTLPPISTTLVSSTTTSTLFSSSTTLVGTSRFFPTLANSIDRRTSMSVANPYPSDARITFEAYSNSGERIAASVNYVLPPSQQLARLGAEIFPGLSPDFNGWMVMKSNIGPLPCFFLLFDDRLNYMDGATVSDNVVQEFILPLKDDAEFIFLNPQSRTTVPYRLEFVSSQGSTLASQSGNIPPMGKVILASNSLVPDAAIPGYFRGYSENGVVPLEIVQQKNQWMAVLNGMDVLTGAEELFAPHYVVGNGYETNMDVINLTFNSNPIRMELFDSSGRKLGTTVQTSIPARGSQRFSGVGMFGVEPPVNGYIRLRGGKLTGSVLFTDPASRSFGSALQFVGAGRKEFTFSQVAQSKDFYTGLAAINTNNQPTIVRVEVFADEWGVRRGWGSVTIPAGGKISRLLNELVGPLPVMTRGYFKVNSDLPIATFAVFGTWDEQALSAIP